MKKRVTLVMAVVCCLSLLVGSLALFTDRADAHTTATAGNIDLVWTDVSSASANIVAGQENSRDTVWTAGQITNDSQPIMNPGDSFDLGYTVKNTGNKAIRVAQEIVLVSDVALTGDAEEYTLTIMGGEDSTAVIPDITAAGNGTKLTYNLSNIVLGGQYENEDDQTAAYNTDVDYDVKLSFSEESLNKFMNSKVDIDYYAVAMQARNTVDGDLPAAAADLSTYFAEGNSDYEIITASTSSEG